MSDPSGVGKGSDNEQVLIGSEAELFWVSSPVRHCTRPPSYETSAGVRRMPPKGNRVFTCVALHLDPLCSGCKGKRACKKKQQNEHNWERHNEAGDDTRGGRDTTLGLALTLLPALTLP